MLLLVHRQIALFLIVINDRTRRNRDRLVNLSKNCHKISALHIELQHRITRENRFSFRETHLGVGLVGVVRELHGELGHDAVADRPAPDGRVGIHVVAIITVVLLQFLTGSRSAIESGHTGEEGDRQDHQALVHDGVQLELMESCVTLFNLDVSVLFYQVLGAFFHKNDSLFFRHLNLVCLCSQAEKRFCSATTQFSAYAGQTSAD